MLLVLLVCLEGDRVMTGHRIIRMLPLASAVFAVAGASAGQPGPSSVQWVPYQARYVETSSTTDSTGHVTTRRAVVDETRARDGSLLTAQTEGGQLKSGKLWLADGQTYSLDYLQKRAIPGKQMVRHHSYVPPAPPTGTSTVAGVPCAVYPILHLRDGHGTICVDQSDDIPMRVEVHMDAGGIRTEYVKEVTSIDFSVDAKVGMPEGFVPLVPATPGAKN